jgi:hypothetical protein
MANGLRLKMHPQPLKRYLLMSERCTISSLRSGMRPRSLMSKSTCYGLCNSIIASE